MVRGMLRGAYEYAVFFIAYAIFGVGGVLVTLISALLYPLLPRAIGARLGKRMIGLLFRGYLAVLRAVGIFNLDLTALDALRGERSLIIAPNHPCLLDAVFVISRIPDVACIMKAPIWDNPVLGGGARLAGYIRNDFPRAMIRQAVAELRAGHPLLVFPEGTRTRDRPVNQFKGGFALAAKRAEATIQTVFIETDSQFLGKAWPMFKKPPLPVTYRARLGARFTVQGNLQRFLTDFEGYYRQELGRHAAARIVPDSEAQYEAVQRGSV